MNCRKIALGTTVGLFCSPEVEYGFGGEIVVPLEREDPFASLVDSTGSLKLPEGPIILTEEISPLV